jgi:hypothetical protein
MIQYVSYKDETQLETIMSLIDQELSEPYSIFTYRYFITLWPDLCFMVCLSSSPFLDFCLTSQMAASFYWQLLLHKFLGSLFRVRVFVLGRLVRSMPSRVCNIVWNLLPSLKRLCFQSDVPMLQQDYSFARNLEGLWKT